MLKIIGLGNELYGDDGIGSKIVSKLRQYAHQIPAELIYAGNDGFIVLDCLLQPEPVIIIDCARMGKKPGSIKKFKSGQIQAGWTSDFISLHGLGLGEILTLVKELGRDAEYTIIGIEPKTVAFNTDLSEEISRKIPAVIDLVMEEIEKYDKKSINH